MKQTALRGFASKDGRVTPQHSTCPGCGDDPGHWLEIVASMALNGDGDAARILPLALNHYLMVLP